MMRSVSSSWTVSSGTFRAGMWAFALEDRELFADGDDRRNLASACSAKTSLLDGRIADVMANRLDQAADARAVDV